MFSKLRPDLYPSQKQYTCARLCRNSCRTFASLNNLNIAGKNNPIFIFLHFSRLRLCISTSNVLMLPSLNNGGHWWFSPRFYNKDCLIHRKKKKAIFICLIRPTRNLSQDSQEKKFSIPYRPAVQFTNASKESSSIRQVYSYIDLIY